MPNDPAKPDRITKYSDCIHYSYDFTPNLSPDMTPEQQVTDFISRIRHDLKEVIYCVDCELIDDENDGFTYKYTSNVHFMEKSDDLELWHKDLEEDTHINGHYPNGEFCIRLIGLI